MKKKSRLGFAGIERIGTLLNLTDYSQLNPEEAHVV